ncbi:MAG: peptidylprolyl isomerase [Holosporales bacterium]|jgi:peptidyl-prolyl cis-trans isomerase SurA|nr:peptidylprolyl isomerase [Holosporales bacterium]
MKVNKNLFALGFTIVAGLVWSSVEAGKAAPGRRLIVKEINGEAVTERDIEIKSRIIALSMGRQYTEDFAQSIREQVIEALINDSVKLQELNRIKKQIRRTELIPDKQVMGSIQNIAKRAGLELDAFKRLLEKHGIPFEVFKKQIFLQVAWNAIMHEMFANNIEISDAEALKEQDVIRKQLTQRAYLLSRIYLPVESDEDEKRTKALAHKIHSTLMSGPTSNFPMLAQQFSKAPEAVNGGWLGWVTENQISIHEARLANSVAVGVASSPINIGNAYVILMVHGKKDEGEKLVHEVKLQKVMMRAPGGQITSDEEARSVFAEAQKLKARMDPLSRIAEIASTSPNIELGPVEEVSLDEIAPQLKGVIEKLPAKSISEPMLFPQGALLIVVWDKVSKVMAPPPLVDIKNMLTERRLSMIAEQYFRDLKRMAYIN